MKPNEEHLLLDLVSRGINLFPSATSQLASRSKVYQARIFKDFLLPHTLAIYDAHQLLEAISHYNANGIKKSVVKQDRKNAGQGVHLFNSPEDIFNLSATGHLPFPFVLQPFKNGCSDIRVVILGDYLEAYRRNNPNNFRHNLHCGGTATPVSLNQSEKELCTEVMQRGGFPYAHLDLLKLPDGTTCLTEINLRGGIRGALITPEEYSLKIEKIHTKYVENLRKA